MDVVTKKEKRKSDDSFTNNDVIWTLQHKEAGYNITWNNIHIREHHMHTIDFPL